MSFMLMFLLFTIIMWAAGLAALRLFDMMIAPGGALDEVVGWQRMLKSFYNSEKKWKNLLGNALGDCEKCMSFWFMPLWFSVYGFMSRMVLGFFITDMVQGWAAKLFVGWVWLVVFWSIGAVLGLFVLLKARKRNGL